MRWRNFITSFIDNTVMMITVLFCVRNNMAKDWAKAFYNSKKWERCRDSYRQKRIRIDGGVCEVCKKNQGYIVHHQIMLTPENINNPKISLNHELLSFECKDCHDEHEGHGVGRKSSGLLVVFDENGQPMPTPP